MPSFGGVTPIAEDRTVDLASVEQELQRLWEEPAAGEDEPSITRVCALNLVALAPDARSAARASEAGAAITGRYPCRVIVATEDPSGPSGIEASISAYCHPGTGGQGPVCCERITLFAAGDSIRQLPWSVTALLSPDVPVFLWLQGDLDLESELYGRLMGVADRVIVDLHSLSRPEVTIPVLASLPHRPAVTDLAWRRTATWRELVASLFDPPRIRGSLESLCDLQIEYAPGGTGWSCAQAAILAAWVGERLGWKPQTGFVREEGGSSVRVMAGDREGIIRLSETSRPGVPPSAINAVLFRSGPDCNLHLSLRRMVGGDFAEASIEQPAAALFTWQRPLGVQDTTWLLGQEIERPHGSPAFQATLAYLAGLMKPLRDA